MNWGTRITILYVGFVAMIGTMVFFTMREHVDLVSADYYQKELKYQDQIDRMSASKSLAVQPEVRVSRENVTIVFPSLEGDVNGNLNFYRPADASRDFSLPISIDSARTQVVPADRFVSGLYTVQISWTANGKNYYNETPVSIP